jgi:type II secretory ATPase GspE/PulE/Tfp pilus assembly ATPase PilB-like protein/DNA-binding response OmpR family regulator
MGSPVSKFSALFLGEQSNDDVDVPSLDQEPVKDIYRILLVDDEPNILKSLKRVFRQENYEVYTASSAMEALQVLDKTPCQLMITDYQMPGMTGADLLRQVKQEYPDTVRIMLTGHADTDAVMAAIKEGAVYKFILKPWNDDDLRISVALALEKYDLKKENDKLKETNQSKDVELNMLAKLAVTHRSQLAIMLNKKGLLNDAQVQKLYKEQQTKKTSTLRIILDNAWIAEEKIQKLLIKDFMFEKVDLGEHQISEVISSLIPSALCRNQLLIPLKQQGRRLMTAMADPMNEGLLEELKFTAGMEMLPVLASSKDILSKISHVYGDDKLSYKEIESVLGSDEPMDQVEIVIEEEDDVGIEELLRGTDEPPAIRLVNAIIMESIRLGASDIHIHPRTVDVVARFRIDGVLQDKLHIPSSLLMPLVSRIKVMAELDITERRRPQDGRITVKTPLRIVDLRISSLPTVNGEKIVMRILDRSGSIQPLAEIGFEQDMLKRIDNVIRKPQGIVLATGPTGSGKTTSLYSMMQHIASPEKNYITVEDPVEYHFEQAGQVMIKDKIGLGFAVVLRSILRQDPDVVLIGEIRDNETAEVAFNAALTGHLVFSTLHTNSTVDTLARLFDLGLKPYVVASAIEAIIAQRLVRRICKACRHEYTPEAAVIERLGHMFQTPGMVFFKGKGCDKCNDTGMVGRAAIYEVLIPSTVFRHGVSGEMSVLELKELAEKEGLRTLIQDAKIKVGRGEISVEEVLRVLGPQIV